MNENNMTELAPATFPANSQLAVTIDGHDYIADLTTATNHYCSMQPSDRKGKALLFKAMNNPDKRIGDCINMNIKIKDIYCEVVRCISQETGEVDEVPRVVLIDDKGVSYQSVSKGIFGAVSKLIQIFGAPTWEDPLEVTIKQVTRGANKMLTLDLVG